MTARRLTLAVLAEDLGVSRATVSNAYNRPDQLSPALRERVLSRARELGFPGPHPVARGLRRGRVGAVGVLVDQALSYAFSDPAAVALLDGLAADLQQDSFGLLLHSGLAATDPQQVRNAVVDAWVVQSLPEDSPAVAALSGLALPVVVIDQPALPGAHVVGIDDESGAAAATGHVVDLGHRRLAVLSMPLRPDGREGVADARRQRDATYAIMRHRLNGAERAAGAAGVKWGDVDVIECRHNHPDDAARAAAGLLGGSRPPTAIVALSDQLALGVLRAARAAGVAVPDQLSVVGFDDAGPAAVADPPLTTVHQPLRERGQQAGSLVRGLLRGDAVPAGTEHPVHLVLRASTGPPAKR